MLNDNRKLMAVKVSGVVHHMLLDEVDANRMRATEIEDLSKKPSNRSKQPSNRSASTDS